MAKLASEDFFIGTLTPGGTAGFMFGDIVYVNRTFKISHATHFEGAHAFDQIADVFRLLRHSTSKRSLATRPMPANLNGR